MLFSSLTFLMFFLPLVIGIYFLMPTRVLKNVILFISSLVFYAWGEPIYIFLIIISTISAYTFSLLIQKEKARGKIVQAKIFLILAIAVNLGILVFFKYSDFITININGLFGTNIIANELPLPIGISFYTFQIMSYIVDVYRGQINAQRNFLIMATYVTLFPQLVAGPIVRYTTIQDELENRKESVSLAAKGIRRFVIGLGKKVIIANQMGMIVDTILGNDYASAGTLLTWFAIICYTFQIYYDFSGYSDMAIGLGLLFGFHFLENFNYPYVSRSITEFWRRWHISLGTWFRDYVYIPLGGNRKHPLRNIFIVWFLTGLWHGASWNYIFWGLYYCILLIVEKYLIKDLLVKAPRVIQHVYALFFIVLGWGLFRIEDLSQLKEVFTTLFVYKAVDINTVLFTFQDILSAVPFVILAIIGSMPVFEFFKNKMLPNKIEHIRVMSDLYLVGVLVLSIMFLIGETFNPFIYFKF